MKTKDLRFDLDTVISNKKEKMFELVMKLKETSYSSVYAQLDDADEIGRLAAEIRLMYKINQIDFNEK